MRSAVAVAVVAVALTSAACTSDGGGTAGTGRFVVRDSADAPEVTAVVQRAATLVNRRVRMPDDVPIEVLACTDGTGYDPEEHVVQICVPEVEETATLLRDAGADDRAAVADGILVETVTHEAGHAVLDALDLGFTGREEDVADQFSAWVLAQDGDRGLDALEDAAYGYEVSASAFEQDVADEHTADGQRAVNFQCWVYGADARDSEHLISKDGLTRARAELCGEEWDDLRAGWDRLLGAAAR